MVSKIGMLRKTFEHKRKKVTGNGGNCVVRSFMIYTGHQTFSRVFELRRMRWVRHVACVGLKRENA
jgi:hypothetical protein